MSETHTAPEGAPAEIATPTLEPSTPPVATLTEEEITDLANLHEQEEANDRTLRVAMSHHSIQRQGIRKAQGEWWDIVGKNHDFDPASENFVLQRDDTGGRIVRESDLRVSEGRVG